MINETHTNNTALVTRVSTILEHIINEANMQLNNHLALNATPTTTSTSNHIPRTFLDNFSDTLIVSGNEISASSPNFSSSNTGTNLSAYLEDMKNNSGTITSPESTIIIIPPVKTSTSENSYQNSVIIPLYAVIFGCCVIGNLLVILTLAQNKRMRTVTNVYLLNLVSRANEWKTIINYNTFWHIDRKNTGTNGCEMFNWVILVISLSGNDTNESIYLFIP